MPSRSCSSTIKGSKARDPASSGSAIPNQIHGISQCQVQITMSGPTLASQRFMSQLGIAGQNGVRLQWNNLSCLWYGFKSLIIRIRFSLGKEALSKKVIIRILKPLSVGFYCSLARFIGIVTRSEELLSEVRIIEGLRIVDFRKEERFCEARGNLLEIRLSVGVKRLTAKVIGLSSQPSFRIGVPILSRS
jgi:hypothetical protein